MRDEDAAAVGGGGGEGRRDGGDRLDRYDDRDHWRREGVRAGKRPGRDDDRRGRYREQRSENVEASREAVAWRAVSRRREWERQVKARGGGEEGRERA